MSEGGSGKQTDHDLNLWHLMSKEWLGAPSDESAVLLSDISPMGFSDAEIAARYQLPNTMTWTAKPEK